MQSDPRACVADWSYSNNARNASLGQQAPTNPLKPHPRRSFLPKHTPFNLKDTAHCSASTCIPIGRRCIRNEQRRNGQSLGICSPAKRATSGAPRTAPARTSWKQAPPTPAERRTIEKMEGEALEKPRKPVAQKLIPHHTRFAEGKKKISSPARGLCKRQRDTKGPAPEHERGDRKKSSEMNKGVCRKE